MGGRCYCRTRCRCTDCLSRRAQSWLVSGCGGCHAAGPPHLTSRDRGCGHQGLPGRNSRRTSSKPTKPLLRRTTGSWLPAAPSPSGAHYVCLSAPLFPAARHRYLTPRRLGENQSTTAAASLPIPIILPTSVATTFVCYRSAAAPASFFIPSFLPTLLAEPAARS